MTSMSTEELLAKFKGNPPADIDVVRRVEAESGLNLPIEYKEFLEQRNGGEGFIGSGYAMLWRAEDLLELNKGYEVSEYAPGLFLFGSDGAGEAFAFDMRTDAKSIVVVPFIGLELSEALPVASTFNEFLKKVENLFNSRDGDT